MWVFSGKYKALTLGFYELKKTFSFINIAVSNTTLIRSILCFLVHHQVGTEENVKFLNCRYWYWKDLRINYIIVILTY